MFRGTNVTYINSQPVVLDPRLMYHSGQRLPPDLVQGLRAPAQRRPIRAQLRELQDAIDARQPAARRERRRRRASRPRTGRDSPEGPKVAAPVALPADATVPITPFADHTLLASSTEATDPTVEEVEANALAAASTAMEVDEGAAVPDYSPVDRESSSERSSGSSSDPGVGRPSTFWSQLLGARPVSDEVLAPEPSTMASLAQHAQDAEWSAHRDEPHDPSLMEALD